ncbi:hypothetical protein ABK040_011947 [Willaertia magna]
MNNNNNSAAPQQQLNMITSPMNNSTVALKEKLHFLSLFQKLMKRYFIQLFIYCFTKDFNNFEKQLLVKTFKQSLYYIQRVNYKRSKVKRRENQEEKDISKITLKKKLTSKLQQQANVLFNEALIEETKKDKIIDKEKQEYLEIFEQIENYERSNQTYKWPTLYSSNIDITEENRYKQLEEVEKQIQLSISKYNEYIKKKKPKRIEWNDEEWKGILTNSFNLQNIQIEEEKKEEASSSVLEDISIYPMTLSNSNPSKRFEHIYSLTQLTKEYNLDYLFMLMNGDVETIEHFRKINYEEDQIYLTVPSFSISPISFKTTLQKVLSDLKM